MLVVYRAMLWMPFLTSLAALGCIGWFVWSISAGAYWSMLPSGFGIFSFSIVSAISFYVRKKMIRAELIAQETAARIVFGAARAVDDYYIKQVHKAAEHGAALNNNEQGQWRNEHTTTSQSS